MKISILLLLFIIGCSSEIENITSLAVVDRIVDGDTVELNNSEKVRFICVNTPEKNEDGYLEATNFLRETLLNKTVLLVKDTSDKDKYGRLLRYVYLDGKLVNSLIAEKGFGESFPFEPDTSLCNEIKTAEEKAKFDKIGIWAAEEEIKESEVLDPCISLGCNGSVAVGSKNSDKWHYCYCKWAKKIKESNLVCFKTTEEAEKKGYTQTGSC